MTVRSLTQTSDLRSISRLQGAAWAAWNASFNDPMREVYQAMGDALYQQDVHERIERLFLRSDVQNAYLDTLLQQGESAR